jgi:hypothetical protein
MAAFLLQAFSYQLSAISFFRAAGETSGSRTIKLRADS